MPTAKEAPKTVTKPVVFSVDHDVPPPRVRVRYESYPFAQMKVGSSVFVPETTATKKALRMACNEARKKLGYRFAVRAVKGGSRAWRVQ